MAYIGSSPTKVVSRQSANIFTYTATANQTAYTGTDANGNTLACTPSDIMVHMNGLRLEESDFTATTTTVTLGSGAAAGDEVTITAFVTFETADAYTKSASDTRYVNVTGDTMSGNLTTTGSIGVGTSAPDTPLHVEGPSGSQFVVEATSGNFAQQDFKIGGTQKGAIWVNEATDLMGYYVPSGWGKNFYTNGAERLRILSGGNVLIGRTTAADFNSGTSQGVDIKPNQIFSSKNGDSALFLQRSGTNGGCCAIFKDANAVGSISVTASATSYNTSSDYRLKENVTDVTDGITRVKQLSPKRFNFIIDADTTVDGFLAHEAQTIVPEAVTGTKDKLKVWVEGEELPDGISVGDNKLDDDGNTIPEFQEIDQGKLVPLLTAALQEAIAKIETLETKVAALEGG
jgi:hypothetical protein